VLIVLNWIGPQPERDPQPASAADIDGIAEGVQPAARIDAIAAGTREF
jgi:hypothetical protein